VTFLIDAAGALLTLVSIGFLLLGGYLAALRLLGARAPAEPLALAVLSLLLATAEAIAVALLLGAVGALRLDLALAAQGLLVLLLLLLLRRDWPGATIGEPARVVARRSWAVLRRHPAPALLAFHGIAAEALRGLLRPPLSWDALMYHLVLAGAWLQRHDLRPVLGPIPLNYFGYVPANGSLWFWWWMAPSHSEFYVNLSALPHWLLLGLAAGAVARELGAQRQWPLVCFLVWTTPAVLRFAATEYVDLLLGACFLAAVYFAMRWLRSPDWCAAIAIGTGLGIAAGTKVLGVPYAAALAAGGVLLARGSWRARVPQLLVAAVLALLLGGYFYARNVALGTDALAADCERISRGPQFTADGIAFPRRGSLLEAWSTIGGGQVLEAFLGTARPTVMEIGLGPQAPLLLLAGLLLPWAAVRERRREGWLAALQVLAQLLFWVTVPFALKGHVLHNVRYLTPAIGLAFAGGIAWCERRLAPAWLEALAIVLLAQDLLQAHATMSYGVRLALMGADVALLALLLLPRLRALLADLVRAHAPALAAVAVLAAVLAAPALVAFRLHDRARALASEYVVHQTVARLFASGWAWLDAHAPDGAVDPVHAPNDYLVYPAMGPRLERELRYVNIDAGDHGLASDYPRCDPRQQPDREAWLRNLARAQVRWVQLARFPEFPWPLEAQWSDERPDLFALRFADATNRVYEFLPASAAQISSKRDASTSWSYSAARARAAAAAARRRSSSASSLRSAAASAPALASLAIPSTPSRTSSPTALSLERQ